MRLSWPFRCLIRAFVSQTRSLGLPLCRDLQCDFEEEAHQKWASFVVVGCASGPSDSSMVAPTFFSWQRRSRRTNSSGLTDTECHIWNASDLVRLEVWVSAD
jgi:hypothetical protein